jgi:alkanesulfonate monooxygenase SsuD/methylene tetrahydromethanopterin reductase-like flavin-dependent oxidoreductase (luciferase family)
VAEPFHVARVFATLDHLSGGRTGWIAGLASVLTEYSVRAGVTGEIG